MVQFSNPSALWLLGLILPIVLLYILKRRRIEVKVPSLLLWKQALEDMRAQTPFQKLRSNLLLFLQILIVVLITAILSQPHLLQTAQESRRWVLVLDGSASMRSTDVKPDRFHVAQSRLVDAMQSAEPSDEILLAYVASEAGVLHSFTTNHDAVRAQLNRLVPEDTDGNWNQLAQLLQPLLRESPLPKIVIASDFAGMPDSFRAIPFEALKVGSSGNNVGITRATAEPLPEDPSRQILFYQLTNFGQNPVAVDVALNVDDALADAFETTLAPSQKLDRNAELTVTSPMTVAIDIKPQDALELDNHFRLILPPENSTKIDCSIKNIFLQKALEALPAVVIDASAKIKIKEEPSDGASPGIFFRPSDPASPAGKIVQWDASHPALRFVDAGLWRLAHCALLQPPADARTLMETALGPACFAIDRNGMRQIHFGFALEDSNLFQLAGFPVFLQNSIEWIQKGSSAALPYLTSAQIKSTGPFEQNGKKGYANFVDAQESNILPGNPPQQSASGTQTIIRRKDISQWFLILAAVIVILEWWAFHRRLDS